MKTVDTLDDAYRAIWAAGYRPIPMEWYVRQGIPVETVVSVETIPGTFGHPRMSVAVLRHQAAVKRSHEGR